MEDSELVRLSEKLLNKSLSGHELMSRCIEILSQPYDERIQYEFQFRAIIGQLENKGVMNGKSAHKNRKNYYNKEYNHVTKGKVCVLRRK